MRSRRLYSVLLTLPLLCGGLLTSIGGSAQAATATTADYAGFSGGEAFMRQDLTAMMSDLDQMQAAGVGWLRLDVIWQNLEPTNDVYRWTRTDQLVQAATERGMRVLALIAYTPAWARPADCTHMMCAPRNNQDYADFVGAFVRRYSPMGVKHIEIWNEPNMFLFWAPLPNINKYADMLKRAYTAAKNADPSVQVITGGLAPAFDATNGRQISPLTFVKGLYAAGAGNSFDALGMHPYSSPISPTYDAPWNAFTGVTKSLHALMSSHGQSHKKVWGTEFGFPTSGHKSVSEADQARYVFESFRGWEAYPFAGPLFWYSFQDRANNPTDYHSNFGVVRFDGSRKLAYASFRQVTAEPWGDGSTTTTTTTTSPSTTTTTMPSTTTTTSSSTTTTTMPSTTTTTRPTEPAVDLMAVNFQPSHVDSPAGWQPDIGLAFSDARGYGWIRPIHQGHIPMDYLSHGVARGLNPDTRLDTFVDAGPLIRGGQAPARWDARVANGYYDVTVTVGDAGPDDSIHRVSVEGVIAIDGWTNDGTTQFESATVRVLVNDRSLTLNPWGGYRTKLVSVQIRAA